MSDPSSRIHRIKSNLMQSFLLFMCRLAFRPKVEFISEKARREFLREPQILACNHVLGMDGAVIYAALRSRRITVISAKDVQVTYPILRWLFQYMPVQPIDRENFSLSWLRDSRRLLREGRHMMIFPEGKCSKDHVIRPFKSGVVLLAASSGARIVPIYHNGIYHYFIGRRFRLMIGEPVTVAPPPEGLSPDLMSLESTQLLQSMQHLEKTLTGTVATP